MFFPNKDTIDSLQDLFRLIREYITLQKELTLVSLTEKLTVLLSVLTTAVLVLVIGAMAMFYLSFTLAYCLEPVVGGLTASFAIITAVLVLLGVVVYALRGRLIYRPIARFVASLFIKDMEENDEED